jgi:MFS family permease
MATDTILYPKYRWLVLIAAALTYANAQIINLSIAPVLPHIAQNLGIDLGVATNFMAAFLFSGCILMFTVGGAFGDRFSGIFGPIICGFFVDKLFKGNTKEVFIIGFILACVFMLAIKTPLFYGNKPLLSAALVLAGFGVQFIMPAVYIFIAKSYNHKIMAKMTGLIMGIGTLGGVFGLWVSGVTLDSTGNYSLAFTLISLAALAGLLLTFILSKMKTLSD